MVEVAINRAFNILREVKESLLAVRSIGKGINNIIIFVYTFRPLKVKQ